MAVGTSARRYHQSTIHYHRVDFGFAQATSVIPIGWIPANSLILKPISGVFVSIVFNAGTNNFLDIGSTASAANLATDLSLLATVFVPLDEATGPDFVPAVDTLYNITMQLSGTAATTGTGFCVLCYCPPDTDPSA